MCYKYGVRRTFWSDSSYSSHRLLALIFIIIDNTFSQVLNLVASSYLLKVWELFPTGFWSLFLLVFIKVLEPFLAGFYQSFGALSCWFLSKFWSLFLLVFIKVSEPFLASFWSHFSLDFIIGASPFLPYFWRKFCELLLGSSFLLIRQNSFYFTRQNSSHFTSTRNGMLMNT